MDTTEAKPSAGNEKTEESTSTVTAAGTPAEETPPPTTVAPSTETETATTDASDEKTAAGTSSETQENGATEGGGDTKPPPAAETDGTKLPAASPSTSATPSSEPTNGDKKTEATSGTVGTGSTTAPTTAPAATAVPSASTVPSAPAVTSATKPTTAAAAVKFTTVKPSTSVGKTKPQSVISSPSAVGGKPSLPTAAGKATMVKPEGGGGVKSLKKGARKKRKTAAAGGGLDQSGHGVPAAGAAGGTAASAAAAAALAAKKRKGIKRPKKDDPTTTTKTVKKKVRPGSSSGSGTGATKKATVSSVIPFAYASDPGLSAAQLAVNEQMRRALEEDQYSANGSIVESDSEEDEQKFMYKGNAVRLDRAFLLQTARKQNWVANLYGPSALNKSSVVGKTSVRGSDDMIDDDEEEEEEILQSSSTGIIEGVAGQDSPVKSSGGKKGKQSKKAKTRTSGRKDDDALAGKDGGVSITANGGASSGDDNPMEYDRDEGSIFGQTTGASNSTWVECDKCKKWRRLRGVVDERKLPPKWYCSMNKTDPARARCSAPEEEYDAPQTAESAADSRTRKHLRVWVRRLQVNEQYESRQPTLTRGKKKSVASSKEPLEWVRCCNPSCGKWRSVLRIMDAKQNVVERTSDGEWYCVMNTWDEKMASCAAPQENLPALGLGLPPWCLIDEAK